MKDYTKYDFAAIVGAEVSVLLKSKVEYGGTLKLVSNKAIFLLMNDNPLALEGRWIAIDEIVPGSLTAKIKVEDMSVKQLKRVLDEDVYNSVVFSKDENVIYEQMEIASELSGDYIERKFHDYIDCTDWGWEHE